MTHVTLLSSRPRSIACTCQEDSCRRARSTGSSTILFTLTKTSRRERRNGWWVDVAAKPAASGKLRHAEEWQQCRHVATRNERASKLCQRPLCAMRWQHVTVLSQRAMPEVMQANVSILQ